MKLITTAAALLLLVNIAQAKNCKTHKITQKAWSSSYLPLAVGPLTRVKPSALLYSALDLNEAQVASATSMSLIDKYEYSVGKILGKKISIKEKYHNDFYNKESSSWEGFCHKWAAASLDKNFADIFEKNEAILCNDMAFSLGELKELATAFHPSSELMFYGMKTSKKTLKEEVLLKNIFPVDDLNAGLFHEEIIFSMKNNEGIIIDGDSSSEIWNHPVYQMDNCDESSSGALDLKEIKMGVYKIPFKHLVRERDGDLDALEEAEVHFYKTTSRLFSAQMPAAAHQIEEKVDALIDAYNESDESIKEYSQITENKSLQEKIYHLRRLKKRALVTFYTKNGTVTLKPGLSLVKREFTIHYKDEVIFADPGEHSRSRKLLTYDILKDEKRLFSFWMSDVSKRPDFAWIPQNAKYLHGDMQDLSDLISTCQPLKYNKDIKSLSRSYNLSEKDGLRNYLRIFLAGMLGL